MNNIFESNKKDYNFLYLSKELVCGNTDTTFDWNFDRGIIRLANDVDTKRPILSLIISTRKKIY